MIIWNYATLMHNPTKMLLSGIAFVKTAFLLKTFESCNEKLFFPKSTFAETFKWNQLCDFQSILGFCWPLRVPTDPLVSFVSIYYALSAWNKKMKEFLYRGILIPISPLFISCCTTFCSLSQHLIPRILCDSRVYLLEMSVFCTKDVFMLWSILG